MAVLSDAQLAQVLYQAGFRGDAIATMIAIAHPESGADPRAYNGNRNTGDNSYGLWQINMIDGMGPERLRAFGLNSNDDLYDPLTNARAAFKLYQGSGGFRDWSTYNRGEHSRYMQAGYDGVQAAQSQGLIGKDFTSGPGTTGGGSAPSTDPNQQAPASTFKPPSDGKLVQVGSHQWLTFDVGGVTLGYFVTGSKLDTAGMEVTGLEHDQLWTPGFVNAGSADELAAVQGTFGAFKGMWDSIVIQVMGGNNPAKDDPEVKRVLAEFAGRPDMSPTELQGKLRQTGWYQNRTSEQLAYNDLPAAEQTKRQDEMASRMATTWQQYLGQPVSTSDPRIVNYVQDLASGKLGFGAWTESIVKATAASTAESPYARTIRTEQEDQRSRGIDIENSSMKIRDTAKRWGINMSVPTSVEKAQAVVEKRMSDDDVLSELKAQSAVMFPSKPPDMETATWASPWLDTHRRVLESDTDLFDPRVQQAMSSGTPVWDFEKQLKSTDKWMGTRNAKEELTGYAAKLGRQMGFV
jgi:Lysozyme like domain